MSKASAGSDAGSMEAPAPDTHSHNHSHSHGRSSLRAGKRPAGGPEPSLSALRWTRAGLLVLIAVVLYITISFCTGIYFDRESAFRNALNCSETALAEAGLTHWLQNGTLLGATRLGRFILWDADLDFGFLLREGPAFERAAPLLDARCFGYRSSQRSGAANAEYRVWRKCTHRLCAEFHEAGLRGGGGNDQSAAVIVTGDGESPASELLPLATCTVAGVSTFCPHNSPYFLAQAYGSAWMTKPLTQLF